MKNKVILSSLSVLLTALLLSGLRITCLLTAYDSTVGYLNDTPLVLITRILYVVGATWCCFLPFWVQKSEARSPIGMIPHILLSNLAGGLFAFSGVCLVINALTNTYDAVQFHPSLKLFVGIFAILATGLFFTEIFPSKKLCTARAAFGFVTLIFLFCLLFYIHFDMYVTINSPLKNALQLSILSAMLFILFRIRKEIGKPLPRASVVADSLCILFCLSTSIGHLVFGASTACGVLERNVISPFLSLPVLAVGVLALSDLFFYKER